MARALKPEATERSGSGLHWLVLLASAVLEAVWALALSESQGFTRLAPSLVFLVASVASMVGLSFAMRGIPLSVAYAVWTGVGAALTVGVAMLIGTEPASVLKLCFLIGIVACVVGLKFAPAGRPPQPTADRPAP